MKTLKINMKKEDLIYKDEEYQIYKKNAGDIGTFAPVDYLTLIKIGIDGLKEWENGGFANTDEYAKILNKVVAEIESLKNEREE